MKNWKRSILRQVVGLACSVPFVTHATEPKEAIEACIAAHPFPAEMLHNTPAPPAAFMIKAIVFDSDGHLYTTAQLAKEAGFSATRIATLSYYSEYPDIESDYRATDVTIFRFFNKPWRHDIAGVLHSLHGGDAAAVQQRRTRIQALLAETLRDEEQDWKSGLMIHALGDAYAHTKNEYGPAEVAYGQPFGHAWHNLTRRSPDDLSRDIPKAKYEAYSKHLFGLFTGTDAAAVDLNAILPLFESACAAGNCPNFHSGKASPKHGTNFDKVVRAQTKCITRSARKLSKAEIQSAIDLIKG